MIFLLGCATELAVLPERAEAKELRVESADGAYVVALSQASAPSAGGVATATTTEVSQRERGKPPLSISSSASSWDLKNKRASFEGQVLVTRGDVTMHCEKLDVAYGIGDVVDTVVATGNVTVDKGSRVAHAAAAELVGATGRITLTGSPRLADGPNELVGDTIVLWLDDERATCTGKAGAPCTLVVAGWAVGP